MPRRSETGFTLVELLLAFSILLVGMTGVISLFSAGLRMEREGSARFETGVALEELLPLVKEELRKQINEGVEGTDLIIDRTDIPSRPGMQYRASATPMPEDDLGRGFLLKIEVFSPRAGKLRTWSYGYLPVVLEPTHEELVRKALSKN